MNKLSFNNNWMDKVPPVFRAHEVACFLWPKYRAPCKYLESLARNGVLIRLKKGVYCKADLYDPTLVASVLHDASYVSFESALGYYNLIPERVTTILSVTTGRTVNFQTPIGLFSYHHQDTALFAKGMDLIVASTSEGASIAD